MAAVAVVAAAVGGVSHPASSTFPRKQHGALLPSYAPLPRGGAGHAPPPLISLTMTASSADATSHLRLHPALGLAGRSKEEV